jgi:hypothetical protein
MMGALVAFVVTLLPAPHRNGVRDLRALLKIAKRHLNMRALDVRERQDRNTGPRQRLA